MPPQQQLPAQQSLYGVPHPPPPQPQVYQQPAPQFQAAASVCPRCHAQLYPGYAQCTNCGLDLRTAWGNPAPVAPPASKGSVLPIALGLVGIGILAFAGAFFVTRNNSTPAPNPSRFPSAVAVASPSAATPFETPAGVPTDAPAATPSSDSQPSVLAPDTSWITLSPSGAAFSAKFPAEPKLTTQTQSTAVGNATESLWTYQENTHLALFVGQVVYPKGSMKGTNTTSVYDGGVAGMLATTAGLSVDHQNDVTLGGHPGRAFTLSASSGALKGVAMQGQMYLIGDNLYMVYAAYDDSILDFAELDAFIADFQLTV
jgi:hypothetical protein